MKFFVTLLIINSLNAFSDENQFTWQFEIAMKEHKNILDYFHLLPSDSINCEGAKFNAYDSMDKRNKIVKFIDIKNGYLEFNANSQIVLFKDRVKTRDIIAIQSGGCGAGNTCGSINKFYTFHKGNWVELTELMPFGSLESRFDYIQYCPYYNLPRFGLTVEIINEFDQAIIEKYKWNKDHFILKRKDNRDTQSNVN